MKLVRVVIEGYRSIAERMELHLDQAVTVILGANDHGKSNLLAALTHLNADQAFDEGTDRNWDVEPSRTDLPLITFELSLSEAERHDLLEGLNTFATAGPQAAIADYAPVDGLVSLDPARPPVEEDRAAPAPVEDVAPAAGVGEEDEAALALDEPDDDEHLGYKFSDVPAMLVVVRTGVGGAFGFVPLGGLPCRPICDFLGRALPRVELFQPQPVLQDSATWPELASEENEFMRGIFYYAGLDARACDGLFAHTDRTERDLERASEQLNTTLRQSWKQGADLQFKLSHRSEGGQPTIQLTLSDPAIKNTRVRASRRSSGFTHFFKLKTTLHARQQEHPASAYIYLFDEPGVYLHPAGQNDLLRVLEAIGRADQIVYSTHSLSMINRTYPARHRLVIKDAKGTRLDTKPYVGRWGAVLDALGVSAAGMILFADHVLLCEGDSEALYIPAILQRLVADGRADIDLNAFRVLPVGNALDADALIRILLESPAHPKLALLADGDDGGKDLLKVLSRTLTSRAIPAARLIEGTSVEDYLPKPHQLYVEAVWRYTAKVTNGYTPTAIAEADVRRSVEASFQERFEEGKAPKGIARWTREVFQDITGLKDGPSKVGLAREYVQLLEGAAGAAVKVVDLRRAESLLQQIDQMLSLPRLAEVSEEIVAQRPE